MADRRSKKIAILGIATLCLAAAYGVYSYWQTHHDYTQTDNAYVRSDIVRIAPKVAGYVVEVAVNDNQRVAAGDVLFRIDPADYKAKVRHAKAALAAAEAARTKLDEERLMQHLYTEEAQAGKAAAQAEANRTDQDLRRARNLIDEGWATKARLEAATAVDVRAQSSVEQARAVLKASQQKLRVLDAQAAALDASIEQASAQLQLSEISLGDTVVRAPASGLVGNLHVELGQFVRPGSPLLAVVSEEEKWIVANFKETQLESLAPGQSVTVRVDAFGRREIPGHVDSISPASGAEFSLLPADNSTGNFIRVVQRVPVKILLEPGDPLFSRLRAGMSAEVRVKIHPRTGEDIPDEGRNRTSLNTLRSQQNG
ncbi:secretion protein HlyD [Tateyamaria omphalii]|uniref:HlyD family secretion protein n=1 Tax=Tateyamaria omphalii TaxID=299262 RepID=UPI0016766EDF|nr:HlyD family secretion protein [Tateyamaria omphalii]GGX52269.1 secretion protein HlyD [Tateyamaria omphalii]